MPPYPILGYASQTRILRDVVKTSDRRYAAFRRRLRDARERLNLRQADVARRLRRPQSYVSKSESGERRVDVIELQGFARCYGQALTYFTGETPWVEPRGADRQPARALRLGATVQRIGRRRARQGPG